MGRHPLTAAAAGALRPDRALLLIGCLALGACNFSTEAVRSNAGDKGTIHVAAPYDVVHRNFVARANDCAGPPPPDGPEFVTDSETIPGKSAVVEVRVGNVIQRVLISADIVAAGDGTDVTYYKNPDSLNIVAYRPVMMEWANGTGSKCGTIFDQ